MNPTNPMGEAEVPEPAAGSCAPGPTNAFSSRYLRALREQDDVASGLEAMSAGPFKLVEMDGGHWMFRVWESPEAGYHPLAVFGDRATALRFMVVWSVMGRERTYRASQGEGPLGVAVESSGAVVGYLNAFNDELLFAAHVVDWILGSPAALAALFEAAGPLAQEIAGQIMARNVEERARLVVGR